MRDLRENGNNVRVIGELMAKIQLRDVVLAMQIKCVKNYFLSCCNSMCILVCLCVCVQITTIICDLLFIYLN